MKIKIDPFKIYILISILPVVWPLGLTKTYFPQFGDFITSGGLIVSIALTIINSSFSKKIFFNNLNILLYTFFGTLILSTVINQKLQIVDYMKSFFSILCLQVCYLNCLYKSKINLFFDIYIGFMTLLIILALISQLLKPEGLAISYYTNILGDYQSENAVYFWGTKNYYGYYLLPYITVLYLRKDLCGRKKLKVLDKVMCLISVLIVILTGSTTSLICLITFLLFRNLFCFKVRNKEIYNIFVNAKFITVMYLVSFFVFVILGIEGGIMTFISNLFNKPFVLTGRIDIWDGAIQLIIKNMIIGYGYDSIIPHVGYYWYAHNLILDILIQGGIISLSVFICIIYLSFKRLNKINSKSVIKLDIICYLFALSLSMLVESGVKTNPFLYLGFYFSYTAITLELIRKNNIA